MDDSVIISIATSDVNFDDDTNTIRGGEIIGNRRLRIAGERT